MAFLRLAMMENPLKSMHLHLFAQAAQAAKLVSLDTEVGAVGGQVSITANRLLLAQQAMDRMLGKAAQLTALVEQQEATLPLAVTQLRRSMVAQAAQALMAGEMGVLEDHLLVTSKTDNQAAVVAVETWDQEEVVVLEEQEG